MAPRIVADRAGIWIDIGEIVRHAQRLSIGQNLLLIEGAGGWYAPSSDRKTMADVARALAVPIPLVVGLRPTCLNHARLPYNADPGADADTLRSAAVQLLATVA